ncbi:hypothetical protein [Maridesulfovibrio sp.]|uniref:hypothetical protein n=1 Tax=Maridesulfovibrio sp. TaxID=2795000 RepID=UPI003B00BD6D
MKVYRLSVLMVVLVFILMSAGTCFAFEITAEDVANPIPDKAVVEVVSAPNPGLVGFFKARKFAYALVEKDGRYGIYARWKKGSKGAQWMWGKIDGDTIKIGNSVKVWITDNGSIYRTYKGEKKISLKKVEMPN